MAARVSASVIASFKRAKQMRSPWEGRWQRLLELGMPYRTSFWPTLRHGEPLATIYDETAMVGIEEMAGRLLSGIFPSGIQWGRLDAPRANPRQQAGLAAVQAEMFDVLDRSNFASEAWDGFKDLSGIGNVCLRAIDGDWTMPVRWKAIALPHVWVTPGVDGGWGDIHVRHPMTLYALKAKYPEAEVPAAWSQAAEAGRMIDVIDSWIRDLSSPVERWLQEVHVDGQDRLAERVHTGAGSCEYIFGRWSTSSGELYGHGQGMSVLPAIEVVNEMRRMGLAREEMDLAGMWQAEDDGVLNPWAVKLEPGTILPIAPHSRGLQPLVPPGTRNQRDPRELEMQRHAIRKALFNETLGPREGTPPTAFEVEERMRDLARQIGPAYHRVWQEIGVPVMVRMRRLLVEQGVIQMPLIDGDEVRAVPSSSMVKAQAIGEVQRVERWAQGLGSLFGPAAIQTILNPERYARWSAERFDVPAQLPNTPEEIRANAQRTGALLGQAAGSPEGQAALGPVLAAMGQNTKALS
jgi:hypothetical protein